MKKIILTVIILVLFIAFVPVVPVKITRPCDPNPCFDQKPYALYPILRVVMSKLYPDSWKWMI